MSDKVLVRGLRNNNPFNIKKSEHAWLGKVEGKDPTFETFSSLKFGVRAGLKLLINYIVRGYDTPEKIIHRFAPTSENNTDNYIDYITRNRRNLHYQLPSERVGSLTAFCMLASRMIKYECCLTECELCGYNLTSSDMCSYIREFGLLNRHKDLFSV